MKLKLFLAGTCFAALAMPLAAQAGVPQGLAYGFHEGNRIAGPVAGVVGAAVGGVVDGVVGGVTGVLGLPYPYEQAEWHSYRPRHWHHRCRH